MAYTYLYGGRVLDSGIKKFKLELYHKKLALLGAAKSTVNKLAVRIYLIKEGYD